MDEATSPVPAPTSVPPPSAGALSLELEARPASARRGLGASALVLGAALLPRVWVALAWAREPVWDGHYYDFGAKRIAAGLGYSDDIVRAGQTLWHPWCHYPVGYSGLLGAVYWLFGSGPHVAPLTNALLGALLALLAYQLGRHFGSPTRALIAGLLVALWPGLVIYAALLMTEPVAALGVVASAWLVARDRDRRPWRGAALGGLALGLATLVRPQSLLCAPALLLLGAPRPSQGDAPLLARVRPWLGTGLLGTACALAVVAPWTLRNCRVMDGCALVSTNGGWNLAIGSFPRATGRFEGLRASDGCEVVTGQVQQDRCWYEKGRGWIASDPGRWLKLMPAKLAQTFDHESFPFGYLGEADPETWPEGRKARGRELLTWLQRALLLVVPLAFVGRPWSRGLAPRVRFAQTALLLAWLGLGSWAVSSETYWPLALSLPLLALLPLPGRPPRSGLLDFGAYFVGSVALTHAVFFGEDRYHVVATPFLLLMASFCLRRPASPRPLDVKPAPPRALSPRHATSAAAALALLLAAPRSAQAFPHVVKAGETLAQLAEKTYGRVELEQLIVAANGLDTGRGVPISPGMRLELPAVSHRRAEVSDTWASLARELLGSEERAEVLAAANDSHPWLKPADGQEVLVPYNLRFVAGAGDSILTVAYRFLGDRSKAWMLDRYNHLEGEPLRRGDVILVPLVDLPLTEAGRAEAATAGSTVRSEGGGQTRELQRRAEAELPQLANDVRQGRYVDAVARGNRLRGSTELSRPQQAAVERALLEAYVALDAPGLAEAACSAWRAAAPEAVLDPVELSPKLLKACTSAALGPGRGPEPSRPPAKR